MDLYPGSVSGSLGLLGLRYAYNQPHQSTACLISSVMAAAAGDNLIQTDLGWHAYKEPRGTYLKALCQ